MSPRSVFVASLPTLGKYCSACGGIVGSLAAVNRAIATAAMSGRVTG
jgi:hypothetical protein